MPINTTEAIRNGEAPVVGRRIATYRHTTKSKREPVLCCGPIHLATQVFWLGAVPGRKDWFILRNGSVFRWTKHRARVECIDPTELDEGAQALWADAQARAFLDAVMVPQVHRKLHPMYSRYKKLVTAFVNQAIIACAANDIEREAHHFARGCCQAWDRADLLGGTPTILHATYVALVCGLEDGDAAQLIEYAGFIEWRVPLWQRETALMIYQEARRLLSSMLPAWWAQGVAFDWDAHATSVHDVFTKQFLRLANDAADRSIPVDTLIATQRALTQLGSSPVTARYLSRTEDIDRKSLEELDKLLGG